MGSFGCPSPHSMTDLNGTDLPTMLPGTGFGEAGKNPAGLPIFRVVSAPSRRYRVCTGNDLGGRKMQEFPLYPGIEQWILERWLPAERFAGSRTAWEEQNRGEVSLGPYPAAGEYVGCFTFPDSPPWSLVRSVIDAILAGDRTSLAEKRRAIDEAHEKRKKEIDAQRDAIIDNAMPAFGLEAININPARDRKSVV